MLALKRDMLVLKRDILGFKCSTFVLSPQPPLAQAPVFVVTSIASVAHSHEAKPMKRSSESPADRAAKHRKFGERRVPLDQLGFHPNNRGGLGCSGITSARKCT